ncbi:MAG: tryptophan synthase subunit alpha [Candidatus Omnitrophica bacterium]|nr:tryptophan synthase subunit alpha [Candidatus Omnitrophota bacterium]
MTQTGNRLAQKLKEAKKSNRKLFCAYVTLGFPKLSVTEELIPALEKVGVDILELGFPFSDPLADGPTIQFASADAIKKGVQLKDAFRLVRRLRKKGLKIPVLFFSYLNPIMHYGVSRTVRQLRQSGFDGLIVPDLPPEEGAMWEPWFRSADLSLIYLIAPTTQENRIRKIAKHSNGFVYYVSLRGVTGMRSSLPSDLLKKLATVKRLARMPVLVGFGVSNEKHARAISKAADGIIVGSAIVEKLRTNRKAVGSAVAFASRLAAAIKKG